MSTRLDRLILLLETGSTQQIKSTAAKQLGEIARKGFGIETPVTNSSTTPTTHGLSVKIEEVEDDVGVGLDSQDEWKEVMGLVGRIIPHLRSKSYDTRSAASLALGEICRSVPTWTPPSSLDNPSATDLPAAPDQPPPFDLAALLSPTRPKLLASSGKEFALPAEPTTREEIEAGKREVMKRLGIGGGPAGGGMDMGFDGLVGHELEAGADVGPTPVEGDAVKKEEDGTASPMSVDAKPTSAGGDDKAKGKAPSKLALKRAEKERLEELKKKELEEGEFAGLSARQVNALKRKRKMAGGANIPAPAPFKPRLDTPSEPGPSTPTASTSASASPHLANSVSQPVIIDPQAKAAAKEAASIASGGAVDTEGKVQWGKALIVERDEQGRERWPWERVVDVLQVGLFSPAWEIRHGAAMGLRDLLKSQGRAIGTVVGYPSLLNSQLSSHALLLLSHSLLTLLALDRFGDYNSDVVVAPVRETASQTLAAIMKHMSEEGVADVHRILVGMVGQEWLTGGVSGAGKGLGYAWEVRHAGLLGLKFEVSVRADLLDGPAGSVKEMVKMEGVEETKSADILKDVVDAAVLGLGDADDDVRSVSAACLLPVATYLATRLPDELARVVSVLWEALSEGGDELGSSTGGVMDLLGKLIAFPQCISLLQSGPLSLVELVPRLFPFFRHTITNVRLAVPNALHLFLTTSAITTIDWIDSRLFRFLLQNILVEERADIRAASLKTWRAAVDKIESSLSPEDSARFIDEAIKPFLGEWLSLTMSPPGVALDGSLFLKAQVVASTKVGKTGRTGESQSVSHNVDKNMMAQDLTLVPAEEVIKCRLAVAQALALLLVDNASPVFQAEFSQFLLDYLGSTSAHQMTFAAVIVQEWALAVDAVTLTPLDLTPLPGDNLHAQQLVTSLIAILEGRTPAAYYEMLLILSEAYAECQSLLGAFVSEGKVPAAIVPKIPASLDASGPPADLFTVDVAGQVAGPTFDALVQRMPKATAKAALPGLRERQMKVVGSIGYYLAMKEKHDRQVSAAVASAVIALRVMPAKLNPVIRSIMNGVKFEENLDLQTRFARSVASFITFCSSPTSSVKSNPTDKIIKNLSTFICQDSTQTPIFATAKVTLDGILTLREQKDAAATAAATNGKAKEAPIVESEEVVQARITSRGAKLAFAELARTFEERLADDVPKLWSCMTSALEETFAAGSSAADVKLATSDQVGQDVLDTFTTLSTVVAHLHPDLHPRIITQFPFVLAALQSGYAVVRQAASRAISAVCDVATVEGMKNVVEEVLPFLGDPTVAKRQGAVEVVADIVRTLDVKALPYVLFMIVPILGRMSDSDDDVRLLATSTFASLVKMVPLEAGIPDPTGFSAEMLEKRAGERQFLNQLLDGSKVDQYEIPVTIKAELRKYQQDGINWLAFLAKYQLHGILCDDMGLGKSLQSLCILASKHHERAERFRLTSSPDSVHLPSLIVCPPTLTGHWYHEILKFTSNLRPVTYLGPLKDRLALQSSLGSYDVVIMSYEVVRNDIDFLSTMQWNYCILDEGHVIKNGRTKLTKAVKMVRANHRLILSGTPIQNNVLELWSLFDFLMPGFLGTERSFNERFGKPITLTRDGKATAKEREAAALALEALHKQVLPFLLRRLKEDVLADLPPKIIQDYYCDLSDVQKQLYDDFSHSEEASSSMSEVQSGGGGEGKTAGKGHVFQSLQYLRKLCNHPCLVAKEEEYGAIVEKVRKKGGSAGKEGIKDLENAPKLMALKQILNDCGIGLPLSKTTLSPTSDLDAPAPAHRVLIFCQLKSLLDLIITTLFTPHLPTLSYLRMDGSTPAPRRHAIAEAFNSDPSIDVLLLTTQVGGLGLNLTGADTVVFVEHDWNPMRDLQAMDRAHRLGQKRVVNVYRLITRGTLEEKIMGLQRFKLNIASSVITQQNSDLASMGTDQVLDLFKISTGEADAADAARKQAEREANGGGGAGGRGMKGVLEGLEDLGAGDGEGAGGGEGYWDGAAEGA